MTRGYESDPEAILDATFGQGIDEMVVLRKIAFTSLCEHHLLPFTGWASVAYLPVDRVVGISKLARLVDCFSRRLQLQERMTMEIAGAIDRCLQPRGTGVLVTASHGCMACRGVRKAEAEMVTSALTGALRTDAAARSEFLALADGRG
jgi:GTP cyclohydrolase I